MDAMVPGVVVEFGASGAGASAARYFATSLRI